MKRIITVLTAGILASSSLLAQEHKAQVLDQATGKALEGATISVWGPVRKRVQTTKDGYYSLGELPRGRYTITITATGYEARQFEVIDGNLSKSLPSLLRLTPLEERQDTDGVTIVEDLSEESSNSTSEYGSLLTSSRDPFNASASYVFSSARFSARGYDSPYQTQLLNGVPMGDLNTGYSPWSLWGGLNDLTRLQNTSETMEPLELSLGNIGLSNNVQMRPSLYRKQTRLTYSNSNRTYSNRLMATWTTGEQSNGWSFAAHVGRRSGNGLYSYVRGVHYDAWSYFFGAEKRIDNVNSLALVVFASPTRRGVASASTEEAYRLVGSNFYNPNVGLQNGEWRNARERGNHEPVVQFSHYYNDLKRKLQITTTASYRFGYNYVSALNWYNAPDPRPDYYRYLPSYFTYMASEANQDPATADIYADLWASDRNTRYIDWDKLFSINRSNTAPLYNAEGKLLANGARALYMIEHRHTDQREGAFASNFAWIANNWLRLNGGINYRYNDTDNYAEVGDLLGASYVYDIDKFAERDFGGDASKAQIDLNNPDHIAVKGDRFSYDYRTVVERYSTWLNAKYSFRKFDAYTGLSVTQTNMQRIGNQRRGLFPDNSFGKSDKVKFLDFTAKAGITYKINGQNYLIANMAYVEQAPTLQSIFVSPRTRNTIINNPESEKIFSADLSYAVRLPWLRGRVTAFYTDVQDKTRTMSFYDDAQAAFSNFTLTGIATRHLGVELGLEAKLSPTLTATGALAWGHYSYNSNPSYVQTIDNSSTIVDQDIVYWKGLMTSGTPQTAATLGLTYRAPWYGTFGINANYFGRNYISMNPVLRTDKARAVFGPEITTPERLKDGLTIDVNAGYSWRIKRDVYLRFNLTISNLLNNKNIHSSGYEQLRVRTQTDATGATQLYRPFDSKYSYMYGTTFFFNTSLQF